MFEVDRLKSFPAKLHFATTAHLAAFSQAVYQETSKCLSLEQSNFAGVWTQELQRKSLPRAYKR